MSVTNSRVGWRSSCPQNHQKDRKMNLSTPTISSSESRCHEPRPGWRTRVSKKRNTDQGGGTYDVGQRRKPRYNREIELPSLKTKNSLSTRSNTERVCLLLERWTSWVACSWANRRYALWNLKLGLGKACFTWDPADPFDSLIRQALELGTGGVIGVE